MNPIIQKAIDNHQKGLLSLAKSQYERIIQNNDDKDGIAAHYLAAIFQTEGDLFKSEKLHKESLLKVNDPKIKAFFLTNYGALLRKIGKLDDALSAYEDAYLINPNIAELNTNLATLYWVKGDKEKALKFAKKSLEIKETCEAHLVFAREYKVKGEYDKAEIHAVKACDLKPNNSEALCLLASIYADLHDYIEAEKYFIKVKKIIGQNTFDFSYATYYYGFISASKKATEINEYAKYFHKFSNQIPLSIISLLVVDLKKYLYWEQYEEWIKIFIERFQTNNN